MAKISELPPLSTPTGDETVPVIRDGVTYRTPIGDLARAAIATDAELADTAGYVEGPARWVGITAPMISDGSANGFDGCFCLPVQSVPMQYDEIRVQLDAAGTGNLLILSDVGGAMRMRRSIAVDLANGLNRLERTIYVPAGGSIAYQRLTGGYVVSRGFTNAHGLSIPVGGIGEVVAVTKRSSLYALGAIGRRVAVAPIIQRQQAAIDANAIAYPAPKRYIIGTFLPRAGELATWSARGVNTIFTGEADYADSSPGGGERWEAAWRATNLDLVRRVGRYSDPAWTALDTMAQAMADALDPRVIAWAMWDEVDNNGHPDQPGFVDGTPGGGGFDPAATRAYVEREIANLRSISATKPIFANLRGYNLSIAQRQYPDWYLDIAGVTWWGSDQYPNTSGGEQNGFLMYRQDGTERYVSTAIGMAADQTIQQDYNFGDRDRPAGSIGKPYFHHLATGRTIAGDVAEQPDRWRCLAWSGVIHGACGHIYFPQMVEGGQYISDDSTAAILAESARLHAAIGRLEAIHALVDPVRGGRIPYLIRRCAYASVDKANQNATPTVPRDDQLPFPFEGAEITLSDGDTLRLVLNLKGTAQAFTDERWGYAALGFGPYEVKAFRASAPNTNIFVGIY